MNDQDKIHEERDQVRYVIGTLCRLVHETAKEKGFWDHTQKVLQDPVTGDKEFVVENVSIIPEKLMLITSEVAEALEDFRHDKMDHIGEELADVVIRVFDLAQYLEVDLGFEIFEKMSANRLRPHMHGKKA